MTTIRIGENTQVILGSVRADRLVGSDGTDIIVGFGGNDEIDGGAGDDFIAAGAGNDIVNGGDGNDVIDGGRGNDVLNGGSGSDELTGGEGRDRFVFDGADPFDGGDVSAAGRQIIGNEDFITDFNRNDDTIVLDRQTFEVDELNFVNALAEDLPSSGANFIVLQNSDNDGNPDTPFLAGTAANLIAEKVTEQGDGFFVYFNSDLGVNRLVYSTDLSDATADLKIVARFTNEVGQDAIDALAQFAEANFELLGEPSAATAEATGGLAGEADSA